MSPPSEKVGGHVPRVPHQIAPMDEFDSRRDNRRIKLPWGDDDVKF